MQSYLLRRCSSRLGRQGFPFLMGVLLLGFASIGVGSPLRFQPQASVTVDAFAGLAGGLSSGRAALALLDLGGLIEFDSDSQESFAAFEFNVLYVDGDSPSGSFVGDGFAVSNLDADLGRLRLFNAILKINLSQGSQLSLGRLAADSAFYGSDTAGLFTNATFGWSPAAMQSGAPAYAVSSLGALLSVRAGEQGQFVSGIYSTDTDDAADRFAFWGGNWDLPAEHRAIWCNELSYSGRIREFAATAKIGGWLESGTFSSHDGAQDFDTSAGAYLVLDRMRLSPDSPVEGFVRVAIGQGDRYPHRGYFDFGITVRSPFASRPDDVLGIAFGKGLLSRDYRASYPAATEESVIELTWQALVGADWSVQPTLQYVAHPSGLEEVRTRDALVLGLRLQRGW